MHILICGGAGYIGSHMARWLAHEEVALTVVDNLSTGHAEAVKWCELVELDLRDADGLDGLFATRRFDAVIHFSALSLVGASMSRPYDYYENNVGGTLTLLEAMRRHEVQRMVFSSTAAVYGEPSTGCIEEDHPRQPINPYGASKLMVERILQDAALAHGLDSVSLRYFNAAGARADAGIGESHEPETHLIPNVLRSVLRDDKRLAIFGVDYPTPDGTCVRDYVHVDDLAQAHWQSLGFLESHQGAHAFNLGNGVGFSVLEVIAAAERVTGARIPFEVEDRRSGDPPTLVASSREAREKLGWQPRYADIDTIISSAWEWHANPAF